MEPRGPSREANEREREIFPLNDGFFLHLLEVARKLPDSDRGRIAVENAVAASEKGIFRYVGRALMDVGGSADAVAPTSAPGVTLPGGSSHDLESALSPATVAAGIFGKIEYPYERPVHPNVNGKELPEELETEAERAEWERQTALFTEQRRAEVQAMKSIAFRFALGGVRVYQQALEEGADPAVALGTYGIPAASLEAFQTEVYNRFMSLPSNIKL